MTASTAYVSALTSSDPRIPDVVQVYAIINRMRIHAPLDIVACADKIMRVTADIRFAPNKTVSELHEIMKTGGGEGMDLLKTFSDMARRDRDKP
jgi:hypothetical protein